MLKSIALRVPRAARTADPATIRTAREAAGWTQDELAELLGVLPVEVAAWESGAIALSPYEGEMIRWKIENAEYEKRLPQPDTERCAWMSQHRDRFDQMEQSGPRRAAWVARTIAAHQRDCPVCGQAQALLRDLPPRPEPPLAPGIISRVAYVVPRLPAWLRVPVKAAGIGLAVGLSAAFTDLLYGRVGAPYDGQGPLRWGLGATFLAFTYRLLRPLGDRKPFLAGQIHSAILVVPAVFALHRPQDIALDNPWLWLVAAMFSGLIGLLLGAVYDPGSDAFDSAPPPPSGAPLLPGTRVPGIDATPSSDAAPVADRLRSR